MLLYSIPFAPKKGCSVSITTESFLQLLFHRRLQEFGPTTRFLNLGNNTAVLFVFGAGMTIKIECEAAFFLSCVIDQASEEASRRRLMSFKQHRSTVEAFNSWTEIN